MMGRKLDSWLIRAAWVIALTAGAFMLMGQSTGDHTITSTRFVLTDAAGNPQAAFESTPNGPRIVLRNPNGKGGLMISTDSKDSSIRVFDAADKTRMVLGVDGDSDPFIIFADANLKRRMSIMADSNGGNISMWDGSEQIRAEFQAPDDGALIRLFDRVKAAQFGVKALDDGTLMFLRDPSTSTAPALMLNAHKGGFIIAQDASGKDVFNSDWFPQASIPRTTTQCTTELVGWRRVTKCR